MNETLIELGKKYLELQVEQQLLGDKIKSVWDDIEMLLEDVEEYHFKTTEVVIDKKYKITEKFETKSFNKDHPKEYQECRKTTKRFDPQLVNEKYPELFIEYNKEVLNSIITIGFGDDKNG